MNTAGVLAVLLSFALPSGAEDVALMDVLSSSTPLGALFSDPDMYMMIMMSLLYANYLTYKTSPGPRRDGFISNASATIPAHYAGVPQGVWERLSNLETHREKGPHVRAFVERSAMSAIVAFRGACFDELVPGCQSDMHMGEGGNPSIADYVTMATKDLLKVQTALGPEFKLLVTGHQLGAFLAAHACEHSPRPCKVITLSGITHEVKLPPFTKLTNDNYFRLYDPIDLEIHPRDRSINTLGKSTLCVYDGLPPPPSCSECSGAAPHGHEPSIQEFISLVYCRKGETTAIPTGHYKTPCFDDTNWLDHWIERILPSGIMPECTAFDESNPSGTKVVKKRIVPVRARVFPDWQPL